jgi:hypothetical protein
MSNSWFHDEKMADWQSNRLEALERHAVRMDLIRWGWGPVGQVDLACRHIGFQRMRG